MFIAVILYTWKSKRMPLYVIPKFNYKLFGKIKLIIVLQLK